MDSFKRRALSLTLLSDLYKLTFSKEYLEMKYLRISKTVQFTSEYILMHIHLRIRLKGVHYL